MTDHAGQGARIILIDDHPAVRQGLALLLAQDCHIICAETACRAETLEILDTCKANIALVDLSLGDESGLDLIADMVARNIPVLIYSMHEDSGTIEQAFRMGACGYVTKREVSAVLLEAVRDVLAGRRHISPRSAQSLACTVLPPQDERHVQPLSDRERQIMAMLGQGDSNAEIASALTISARTVESYFSRIIEKMNFSGMKELRKHAIRKPL